VTDIKEGQTTRVDSVRSHYNNTAKRGGILQSGHHLHLIKSNLFSPWYNWQFAH